MKEFVQLLMGSNTTGIREGVEVQKGVKARGADADGVDAATATTTDGGAADGGGAGGTGGAGGAGGAGDEVRLLSLLRELTDTMSHEAAQTLASITGAPSKDHFIAAIGHLTLSGLHELRRELANMGL